MWIVCHSYVIANLRMMPQLVVRIFCENDASSPIHAQIDWHFFLPKFICRWKFENIANDGIQSTEWHNEPANQISNVFEMRMGKRSKRMIIIFFFLCIAPSQSPQFCYQVFIIDWKSTKLNSPMHYDALTPPRLWKKERKIARSILIHTIFRQYYTRLNATNARRRFTVFFCLLVYRFCNTNRWTVCLF